VSADLRMPIDGFSVTALFGPSGCGKTTILRCLAGLERPESGSIRFRDEVWFDPRQRAFRTPQQRGVGYLFQEYALFPHLRVADNVAYGLPSIPRDERKRRLHELLDAFGLRGLASRFPHQISGGEQQRVALARCLGRRPRLLLLDEPLSSLDAPLRGDLRLELQRQLASFQVPTVLVTHDRIEALSLADHVAVLTNGRIRQCGDVESVFTRPNSAEVARSVGIENVIPAVVAASAANGLRLSAGPVEIAAAGHAGHGARVHACIRAEVIDLRRPPAPPAERPNAWAGRVTAVLHEGPQSCVSLDCGLQLIARVPRRDWDALAASGVTSVLACVDPADVHVVPADAEASG
jgi:molybdate transport system ATP-binding protein